VLSKELTAASTRPLLLSILRRGENYGYALAQEVKELSGGRIEWSEGMLYPVLHRLEQEGLIEAQWKESGSGKRRKYYRLRSSGRTALGEEQEQWLAVHQTLEKLWKIARVLTWNPR
jgi:PadR family transcriptional regulator, regulatory protein PadR